MPREFPAVDVQSSGCAVGIEFHAVRGDVSLFFSEELRVPWGVGEEEGGDDAEDYRYGAFDEEDEWPVKFLVAFLAGLHV